MTLHAIAKALVAGFCKDWLWRLLHAAGRAVFVLLPLVASVAHPVAHMTVRMH